MGENMKIPRREFDEIVKDLLTWENDLDGLVRDKTLLSNHPIEGRDDLSEGQKELLRLASEIMTKYDSIEHSWRNLGAPIIDTTRKVLLKAYDDFRNQYELAYYM